VVSIAPEAMIGRPGVQSGTARSEQRAEDTLRGRIREAVQAAVRCPAAARMMGLSGKAGVAFDYRDGALIGGVQLSRSTGVPMLDAAALAAVRDAHYPNPPPEVASHVLRLLVWIEESCGA
jgi:protein TonB